MDARYLHLGRVIPRVAHSFPDTDGAIPSTTLAAVPSRIIAREESSPSSTRCPPGDNSGKCEKSVTSSTFTLPIVLGIAIPVVVSAVLFFYLHRRHLRKQREEDNNERHASLDFGMGDIPQPGRVKKKGIAGLTMPEKSQRQVSMDMALSSPYLLPPELHDSRESLQSLSRTLNSHEDPYRPVAQLHDGGSIRSHSRGFDARGHDNASIMTGSSNAYSHAPSKFQETSTTEFLSNASSMPRNNAPFVPPPRNNSLPATNPFMSASEQQAENAQVTPPYPVDNAQTSPPYPEEPAQAHIQPSSVQRKGLPANPFSSNSLAPAPATSNDGRESVTNSTDDGLRHSNNYLGAFINEQDLDKAADSAHKPPSTENAKPQGLPSNPRANKASTSSAELPPSLGGDENEYGDGFKITPPSPKLENAEQMRDRRYSMDVPPEEFVNAGLGAPGFDARRLSMGFRPLPPDAVTEVDDPELRANRIRSFYKEYFDDSKPAPEGQYYEDYDEHYLGDGAYYDPGSNNFVMPYAEPVTRRAMTPPPRGPPRFQGPPRGIHSSMGGANMNGMGMGMGGVGMRGVPGPRAYSSASGPMGGPRAQSSASQRTGGGPRRPLPPPEALPTLPTPSKLRDDSFALFNAMDFAPPTSVRDRVAGRSESPLGERRPYSPAVPAFVPTNSAFDELPDMAAPHLLRKSGTFTGLDFAPPKRFKDPDTMSDAGSIRSNRSGVSAMQLGAIRSGAYRVSRLPQDFVGTRDDLAVSLKPQWGMRPGAS